jgi:uncharacterized membrane protein YccC
MKRIWPWRIWTAFAVAFIGANLVWDLVWFYRWPEFYAVCLVANCISLAVILRSNREMTRLHRDYVARMEGLDRRLDHAIERDDRDDINLTLALMRIWNHEPSRQESDRPPPS